jgi:hypothetical protein
LKRRIAHSKAMKYFNSALGLALALGCVFSISIPVFAVAPSLTSPDGGEDWEIGSSHNITWANVLPTTLIDVGSGATDLGEVSDSAGFTLIDRNNPANATGVIDTVQLLAVTDMTDVYVAAFYYVSDDLCGCRGSAAFIPSVTAGSVQTFSGLSIPIQTGDWIGFYSETGNINASFTAGAGTWYKPGNTTTSATVTNYVDKTPFSFAIAGFSIVDGVSIELSRDNGGNWETLFEDDPNDGTESWTVTGPPTTQALIRVLDMSESELDRSDSTFSITDPAALHVSSITMKYSTFSSINSYAGTYIYATARVKVVDENGSPVLGARVYGVWSVATSDSDNGLTNGSGMVSLDSNKISKRIGIPKRFTFTVKNIVLAGYSYDADANVKTSGTIMVS